MIAPQEYHNVRTWLEQCRRPLLVTHRRPDGDAIGAVAALTRVLRDWNQDPRPTLFEPFPPRYAFLADLTPWHNWDHEHAQLTAECDALVILDTCALPQLEPLAAYLPQSPRTLVIDHHATRDPLATRPTDLCLVDESAGAASLLVAEWMQTTGVPLTPPIATALLTGLATDCGWFRFANTDARMLRTAAELSAAGASVNAIYRAVHEQDPLAKLRLIARMLQTLELHADGRLAVLSLRRADFEATGADRTMTEDVVNEPGRLAGLEATILFTEERDGRVRVNFRSKSTLDVAALAARFGGGGHTRAAGARPPGKWEEVLPRVIAETLAALGPATRP
jgi:phosphoesterase RecJ-like protein